MIGLGSDKKQDKRQKILQENSYQARHFVGPLSVLIYIGSANQCSKTQRDTMRGKTLTFSKVQFFLQACMDKKELLQFNSLLYNTVHYQEEKLLNCSTVVTWVLENGAQCTVHSEQRAHRGGSCAVIELIHRDPEGRTQLQEAPTIKHSISIRIFPPF